MWATDQRLTLLLVRSLNPGPPRKPLKIIKFPACLQDPQKSWKVIQGPPKGIKIQVKSHSGTLNYWISRKSEITQNTWFLHCLWHIQSLHSGIISIPGAQKTWTWKLSPSSPPQITENKKKCAQSMLQEAPQIQSQIVKNGYLGISVAIGCPPGP